MNSARGVQDSALSLPCLWYGCGLVVVIFFRISENCTQRKCKSCTETALARSDTLYFCSVSNALHSIKRLNVAYIKIPTLKILILEFKKTGETKQHKSCMATSVEEICPRKPGWGCEIWNAGGGRRILSVRSSFRLNYNTGTGKNSQRSRSSSRDERVTRTALACVAWCMVRSPEVMTSPNHGYNIITYAMTLTERMRRGYES